MNINLKNGTSNLGLKKKSVIICEKTLKDGIVSDMCRTSQE